MNSANAGRSLVSDLVGRLEIRMLALAIALGAALSILSPHFLTSNNLLNVLDQSVVVGIVAIGMTFVILIGGIDLSVGSVAGLTGVLLGRGLEHFTIPVAIVLAVFAGMMIGPAQVAARVMEQPQHRASVSVWADLLLRLSGGSCTRRRRH